MYRSAATLAQVCCLLHPSAAISAECHDIEFKIEGEHAGCKAYAPGVEIGVTAPMLVLATAKAAASAPTAKAGKRDRLAAYAEPAGG